MSHLLLLVALLQQEPTYAELTRKHGLGPADQLMRDGKYLEAAVAYRNILLAPGDHEAVRVPLALALLAKGDAAYAGVEIRRAHLLYPDFSRLVIDPAEIFKSKGVLAKAAEAALAKESDGEAAEVNAMAAYAFLLEGERERAQAVLAKYAQSRGADAYVRDLKAALAKAPAPKPVAVATPAPAPPPLRGGDPIRAGARFIEPEVRPRGETLAR
jgi:Flp pilus assembly protein TadD